MPLNVKIVTPENVVIRYQLAGLATRGVAFIYDLLIQILLLLVFGFLGASMANELSRVMRSEVVVGLIIAINFIIFWGYYIFFEVFHEGQTPGKKYMGIKVVTLDGHNVDFFPSAARNILRVADFLPPIFLGGIISIFLTERHQRIGDLISGTIVIRATGKTGRNIPDPRDGSFFDKHNP